MESLISAASNAGGDYLAAAVMIGILVFCGRAGWALLKREWDRNDKVTSQMDALVKATEKQAENLETVLGNQASLKRDLQDLLDRTRVR